MRMRSPSTKSPRVSIPIRAKAAAGMPMSARSSSPTRPRAFDASNPVLGSPRVGAPAGEVSRRAERVAAVVPRARQRDDAFRRDTVEKREGRAGDPAGRILHEHLEPDAKIADRDAIDLRHLRRADRGRATQRRQVLQAHARPTRMTLLTVKLLSAIRKVNTASGVASRSRRRTSAA